MFSTIKELVALNGNKRSPFRKSRLNYRNDPAGSKASGRKTLQTMMKNAVDWRGRHQQVYDALKKKYRERKTSGDSILAGGTQYTNKRSQPQWGFCTQERVKLLLPMLCSPDFDTMKWNHEQGVSLKAFGMVAPITRWLPGRQVPSRRKKAAACSRWSSRWNKRSSDLLGLICDL